LKTNKVETALVIGGASGLGRASAKALALQGIRVFVADLRPEPALETVEAIRTAGGRADAFQVDTSRSASVSALFEDLKKHVERLDLMVHTAAILGKTSFIEDLDDDEWRRMMAVNLDGVFYCCREAVRWMKVHRSGRLIIFSSVASLAPAPGSIHYSAAKGGVNMLGKTLAQEAAKYNIRVNLIAPGYIATPMLAGLPQGFEEYVLKKTPLKRLGEEGEIAGLVVYLASREADFFTGQILSPNGGLVI
jgi:NAD(P)-dependent dehydrogenase (short-subunit alcohol dehydrogenase family)